MKKEILKPPSRGKSSRRGMTRWREPRNEFLFPEMSENPWRIVARKPRSSASREATVESLTTLELCAGAGGQALGLEQAGLEHAGLVELDSDACSTLRMNRPSWNVIEEDLNHFDGRSFKGVDIISGGLPCPPFSVAGKQLGTRDERNLFPTMIRLVDEIRPRAVMVENVRGILEAVFQDYRFYIASELKKLGYQTGWKLLSASDFGVPPEAVLCNPYVPWRGFMNPS